MDVNTLNTEISELLKAEIGENLLSSELQYDFPVYTIKKAALLQTLSFLKNDAKTGFSFLTTLCGLHFPDKEEAEFGVMYQLHNLEKNLRIRIKVFMPKTELAVPSVTPLWPAANWMERQEYDFFGFEFTGHPDLRRILNMDEMNYFPLRKEYPLEDASRDDKSDKMFGR